MTTRRNFLAMCGLAPMALSVLAKEAIAPELASGGWVVGETPSEYRFGDAISTLKLDVDTSAVDAWLEKQQTIRNAHQRYLNRTGTPMKPAVMKFDVADEVPAMYAGVPIDPGPAGFHNWPELEQVDLTRFRLVYLGSPYTKYTAGIEQAFRDVSAITAEMLRDGVKVYSPIAHTHPIATYGNLDPLNHEIWLPFDQAMMDAAEAMVVADMDGWRDSYGVRYEIDYFRAAGKPVYFRSADGSVDILR